MTERRPINPDIFLVWRADIAVRAGTRRFAARDSRERDRSVVVCMFEPLP
jgi:hypothetical protein